MSLPTCPRPHCGGQLLPDHDKARPFVHLQGGAWKRQEVLLTCLLCGHQPELNHLVGPALDVWGERPQGAPQYPQSDKIQETAEIIWSAMEEHPDLAETLLDEINRLRAQGVSLNAIAQRLNASRATVQRYAARGEPRAYHYAS